MTSAWLRRGRPAPGAHIRLFCFPYAGGTAAAFRDWPAAFAGDVEVVAIELPGHGSRYAESPLDDVGALAAGAVDALRGELDPSFALFGHSFGALVAFEVARLLEGEGHRPRHLVVSGSRGPSLPPRRPLAGLPPDELVASLRELNGTPDAVLADPQLLELLLPLVRADLAADEAYLAPETAQLDCPVLALGGRDDPTLARGDLAAWDATTAGEFRLLLLPGDHFYLQASPRTVVEVVEQALRPPVAA